MKKRPGNFIACLSLLLAAGLVLALTACGGRQRVLKTEDGVLIYAALNPVSAEILSRVKKFNNSHEDVQIEIRDYSDEGGLDRLRIELALGQVPDIMELHYFGTSSDRTGKNNSEIKSGTSTSWKCTLNNTLERVADEYWMPYRQMAQKGYLEDLWPYIENDPDLGRDGVLEAPMKAAEVNGGLYMIFMDFRINTMMGRESVVGDRYSWTLEDVMEVLASMTEGSTILRYNATKWDIFYDLLCPTLERYVNRETGECSFDSQNFRNLVGFLKRFPDEVDADRPQQAAEEVIAQIMTGRQMLEVTQLSCPEDLLHRDALWGWGERAAFVGYPTADGSSGSFFYPMGDVLAMSSVCRNKEAAWEYIREYIMPQRSTKINVTDIGPEDTDKLKTIVRKNYDPRVAFVSIPVNRYDYEVFLWGDTVYYPYYYRRCGEKLKMSDPLAFFIIPWKPIAYGPEINATRYLTVEDGQRFDTLLNNTTQLYWPDDSLTDIVWDTLGAYFAGDRDLDATVALIQNRVRLYVNDNM